MRRREFISLIGGAAAAWPFSAQAQQGQIHRIGVLSQDLQPGLLETFRDELQKRGYVEGNNVKIELRNAGGHNERLPALAEELLKLKVDVIVAVNTPAAQAAKKATKTVPVVMMRVADPVRSGLVASLARPGGNVTGLSFMPEALGPKGVELLHEMLPKITRIAALYQGNNPGAVIIIDDVQRKGEQIGLNFVRLPVKGEHDLTGAFETAAKAEAEALFVMDDGAMTEQRQRILELAAKHRLPVVSIYRDFAKSGGLIAYGPNLDVVYRRAAVYVDKLIKGAPAPSLPVEQPVNFYLAVNLKAAKALGLTIPSSILVRAEELIE
ncbi:MAG TPA: ABC transporter substrate-binding protein [Pseudolabrys sp.]|nr:ABC transporter substrate-binding protein [Pseudolabrys sp.]